MDKMFGEALSLRSCGDKSALFVLVFAVVFAFRDSGVYLLQYKTSYEIKDLRVCNVTLNWSSVPGAFSLRPPEVDAHFLDRAFLCRYTFVAASHHRVSLRVRDLRAGRFSPSTKRCEDGHLKIWDGSRDVGRHLYPPSTLCGYYDDRHPIDVHRISSGSVAEMDFYVGHATSATSFSADVSFLDLANETLVDSYPKQLRSYMEQVQNTASVCYWRLYLDTCPEGCPVLSPGYPGIYPPNTECIYQAISGNQNTMIQIRATGSSKKLREFNLQKNCRTDYLEIYDGSTKEYKQKIGRFCGQYLPNITTSANDVLMYFVSGDGWPPYTYSGFHLSLTSVTKEWHKDGYQLPKTICSWIFNATAGSTSSPEHWLPKKTTCEYSFWILPGHYLEIILHIYGLEHNCMDYMEVVDGHETVSRLCDTSLRYAQETFRYNLTSSYVTVRYYTTSGQMEGQGSRGFWLAYRQLLDTRRYLAVTESSEKAQPVVNFAPNKASHSARPTIHTLIVVPYYIATAITRYAASASPLRSL